jgi:aminoglycoside 3-N-acetyltransferase I
MMPSRSFDIERLGRSSIPQMRDALRVFADAFDEEDSFFSAPPGDSYLERLLSDERFILLTASVDDKIVGALSAYELVKYERERSELYIYDLAVAEPFRRNGIARSLIEAIKPIARAAGAWMIFVQADRGDNPAIGLYRSMGVEEEPLHFDISPD